jgi:hypothetical protein
MLSPVRSLLTVTLIFLKAVSVRAETSLVIQGVDHVPVAVSDLERSTADFEALGFTLKPGRPHENGLHNAHVKFPDGTEIELITSPAATDALSSEYHTWIKTGDGPAYLGIYAPNYGRLVESVSPLGLTLERKGGLATFAEDTTLRRVFFASRQYSPTDQPRHFDHANSAFSLTSVWMAGAEAEQRLLQSLDGLPVKEPRCGPLGSGSVLKMPEGEIIFLPASAQLIPNRSIVGVSVTVRSLERARSVLTQNRIPLRTLAECDSQSVWVGPAAAHGMWIDFRQGSE